MANVKVSKNKKVGFKHRFAVWAIPSILFCFVVCAFVLGYNHAVKRDANYCVMNSPLDVVSGEIRPPWSGVFNTTPQTYYLWYRGKWKLTEGACKTRRCVTEREYERQIYGY